MAITRVGIECEGAKGHIVFNDSTPCWFQVIFPDEGVRQLVEAYLTREREFIIPESDRLDDFRIEVARPIDSTGYLQLALSTLWASTRVWVRW